MIKEIIEKHGVMRVSKALEVRHGTVISWRKAGCLPYFKAGSRIKHYERGLAKLEGVPVAQLRKEAYAEYMEVQKAKAA